MLLIAVANGALREWYRPFTGELLARRISTLALLIFFTAFIFWITRRFPFRSGLQAVQTGGLWMILTLVFEFSLGLWSGHSWHELMAEYNLVEGKLWILVPVWLAIAPYLCRKTQVKG
jgi:hypothetical protein